MLHNKDINKIWELKKRIYPRLSRTGSYFKLFEMIFIFGYGD